MRSVMKLRLLVVSCLIAPLAGCVSLGNADFLVTPVAVVGVYSFAPDVAPVQDTESTRPEQTLTADAGL
jgi:hypothetical protein